MTADRLVFALEGKDAARVGLGQFEEALANLAGMLSDVEEEISGQRARVTWEVAALDAGSAIVALEPATGLRAEERALATRVGQTLTAGLRVLAAGGATARPPFFNNRALDRAASLARMLRDGLASISLSFGGEHADLALAIEATAKGVLEYMETIGSLDGYLEVLEGREGRAPIFRVRERVYGTRVACLVPESLVAQALAAWRKRVLVSGSVHYDSDGRPQRVVADSIEVVPTDGLPEPEAVRGILGDLGGMDPEDYLEYLYHGKQP